VLTILENWKYHVCTSSRIIIAIVLLLGIVMKYLGMSEFAKATDIITIVPFFFRKLLPVVVPLVEIVLVVGLLVGKNKRFWIVATFYTFLVFSGYLIWLIINPWAPHCDCLGLLRFAEDVRTDNIISLIRNIVLLFLLWLSYYEEKFYPPDKVAR
jgi:hypothetical protein